MNIQKEISRLNEDELMQSTPFEASWHRQYENKPWIYVGGLANELTEGDVICVFSQWGEIEDITLVRDKDTGKSKGFAFIRYENWLSTVLAVDNMNGTKLLDRSLTVDHKPNYKPPKEVDEQYEKKKKDSVTSHKDNYHSRRHSPSHSHSRRRSPSRSDSRSRSRSSHRHSHSSHRHSQSSRYHNSKHNSHSYSRSRSPASRDYHRRH
ncbi:hypothetical protein WA158_001838 [Blastocystis sp. Blastoise]